MPSWFWVEGNWSRGWARYLVHERLDYSWSCRERADVAGDDHGSTWPGQAGLSYHARDVKPDNWHCFLRVLDETKACAEAVNLARE